MKTFVDAAGKAWTLAMNLETAMRIRDLAGVDILQPEAGDPPLITRLGMDELLLAQVVLAMITPQMEAAAVTEKDVRMAFDGRTILDSQVAFYAELTDFFQSRGRTDRAMAVAKQCAVISLAIKRATARVEELVPENIVSGEMSGESPEHSE